MIIISIISGICVVIFTVFFQVYRLTLTNPGFLLFLFQGGGKNRMTDWIIGFYIIYNRYCVMNERKLWMNAEWLNV